MPEQRVDQLGVREHAPVRHESEVEVEGRAQLRPAHELRANGGLPPAEHDHLVAQRLGAVDLGPDLGVLPVEVAHVQRVAERAMVVAPVADFDERLHRPGARVAARPGYPLAAWQGATTTPNGGGRSRLG